VTCITKRQQNKKSFHLSQVKTAKKCTEIRVDAHNTVMMAHTSAEKGCFTVSGARRGTARKVSEVPVPLQLSQPLVHVAAGASEEPTRCAVGNEKNDTHFRLETADFLRRVALPKPILRVGYRARAGRRAEGTASRANNGYIAPVPRNTAGTVLRRIRRSSPSDQLSMYSRSRRIH